MLSLPRINFEAGALEVWIVERSGVTHFFLAAAPEAAAAKSKLCPKAPVRLED